MIVNLYVDHLMAAPPASAEEVWNATRVHGKLFAQAAARIGLTPREYSEFRSALLDGKAVYVRLPRRLDAMSGVRRGYVYAVHNAVLTTPQMGWRVDLADGNAIYVPQICGNISLLRQGAVAHVQQAPPRLVAQRRPRYVQAIAQVPHAEPVSLVAPEDVAPPVPENPATVAQAVPGGAHNFPLFALIPAAVGGIIAGVSHGNTTPVPPCTGGSNILGACRK